MNERAETAAIAAAPSTRLLGMVGAVWGVVGVMGLLANAVGRMWPMVVEALAMPLQPLQWVALVGGLVFMGFSEGYRGFQRGFSPRVVVRALHLSRHPRPLHVLLAPLFCMGLIHASRRRLVASWILTTMIVCMIVAVGQVPQPWRGIIDAGVIFGLVWGVVALVAFLLRALAGSPPDASPELPESREAES